MESPCKDWKFSGAVDVCLEGLTKVMIDYLRKQSRGLARSGLQGRRKEQGWLAPVTEGVREGYECENLQIGRAHV